MNRITVALLLLTLTAERAAAHAVSIDCKLKGNEVVVEAYFDDDTPAGNARLTVVDEADKVIVEGKSDARGLWKFARPKPGVYAVTVDAGVGHRKTVKVTVPATGKATPAEPPAGLISEGPSRTEFTRVPWTGIGVGLVVLSLLGLGPLLMRRARRQRD